MKLRLAPPPYACVIGMAALAAMLVRGLEAFNTSEDSAANNLLPDVNYNYGIGKWEMLGRVADELESEEVSHVDSLLKMADAPRMMPERRAPRKTATVYPCYMSIFKTDASGDPNGAAADVFADVIYEDLNVRLP